MAWRLPGRRWPVRLRSRPSLSRVATQTHRLLAAPGRGVAGLWRCLTQGEREYACLAGLVAVGWITVFGTWGGYA